MSEKTRIVRELQEGSSVQVDPGLLADSHRAEAAEAAKLDPRRTERRGFDVSKLVKEVDAKREAEIDAVYAKKGMIRLRMTEAELQESVVRMEEKIQDLQMEAWDSWVPVQDAIDALSEDEKDSVFPTDGKNGKKGGAIVTPTLETASAWLVQWKEEPRGGLFKSKKAKAHDALVSFLSDPSAVQNTKRLVDARKTLEEYKARHTQQRKDTAA